MKVALMSDKLDESNYADIMPARFCSLDKGEKKTAWDLGGIYPSSTCLIDRTRVLPSNGL